MKQKTKNGLVGIMPGILGYSCGRLGITQENIEYAK